MLVVGVVRYVRHRVVRRPLFLLLFQSLPGVCGPFDEVGGAVLILQYSFDDLRMF